MNLHQREQAMADLDAARLLLDACLPQAAELRLNACLKRDPDLALAHQAQARLCLMRSDPQGALAALDRQDHVAGGVSLEHERAKLRVKALVMSGQVALARTLLKRLCDIHPQDAALHRMSAGLSDQKQAGDHLARVVAIAPEDASARRMLALHSRPDQAIDHLSQAPTHDAVSQLRAARQCVATGRLADAQQTYGALLTNHRDDARLWIEAARCDDQMGEHSRATGRLRHALSLGGATVGDAWSALGRVQLHMGDPIKAGRSWWHATRCCVHDATAWAGLMICAQLADRCALRKKAQSWLHDHASRSERRLLLARLWQDAGSACSTPQADLMPSVLEGLLAQSLTTLQGAVDQQPHRADAHYHAAVCCQAMGDVPQAYRAARKALSINPQYAGARRLSMRLALSARRAA